MRVLVLHNAYQQFGGEDVVVANELELLDHAGHTVRLLSVNNDSIQGPWRKFITFMRVTYNASSRALVAREIAAFNPDVVHVHNFFPLLTPSVYDACIDAGVPVVQTLHNFRILCPTNYLLYQGQICERSIRGAAWWTVAKRVYRHSFWASFALARMVETHKRRDTWNTKVSRLIALSEFAYAKFVEGGIKPQKLVLKPNYPDELVTQFQAGSRDRYGALFVGRISEEKGVRIVVEAWRGLEYPLRIVGEGPRLRYLRVEATTSVEFLGRLSRDKILREMAGASMLVMASMWYEMFPMVLVEAFACSLPAIVPNLGSMAAIVDDGVTGLHFEPGNSADLRRKVEWAVAHPEEMRRMGENARRVFEEKYTAEGNLQQLLGIFETVIEEQKSVMRD